MAHSILRIAQRALCAVAAGLGVVSAVQAADTLEFCAEDRDIRPWIHHDGTGLNFVLLDRAAERIGVKLVYRRTSWKRCLDDLRQNAVQGAFGASYKIERMEFGAYPGGSRPDVRKRLNMDRYVLVRPKGAAPDWDGKRFRGLSGAVGVQLGYSIADDLRGMGVAVDEGTSGSSELLRKLLAGHVELAALLEGEARSLLAEEPRYAALLEILTQPLVEKPYYLMLSHRLLAARPELADALWLAIEQVRESRDYQLLEKQALEKPH